MFATIQKWGNSQAIRLPKGILEAVDLHENDRIEINAENDIIVIRRANKKHKKLEERLAGYTGEYKSSEWNTGETKGNEVW
jgi:antitoxin MazE